MITYILAIIPGWLCGALVNYLADILPLRRRLTKPFCIQCDTTFSWVNYLLWPRKCPTCGLGRSLRVWVVEVFYIAASILMSIFPPHKLGYGLGLLTLGYLGVVVLIDLEYRLIMHPVSIFGAGLGLVIGFINVGWWRSLLGGVVGFATMGLFYLLGVFIMRVVSHRRGQLVDDVALGFGDVNLSGVLGLMLGWPVILIGLVVAVFVAGIVSLFYIIFKLATRQYQAFMALPYGPFLVLGAVVLIYFRDLVLQLVGG
jgi:prepilin signal peptidase PulO-like enzyme (type II secretory pathway)